MVKYNRIRKKIKPTGRSERPPRPRIKAGKAVRKFRPYGSIFARTAVPKKGDYGLFAVAHRSSRPLGAVAPVRRRLRRPNRICGSHPRILHQKGDYGLFAAAHRSSRPLGVSRLRVVACGDRTASAVRIQVFYTNKEGEIFNLPLFIGRRLRIRTADPLGVNEML